MDRSGGLVLENFNYWRCVYTVHRSECCLLSGLMPLSGKSSLDERSGCVASVFFSGALSKRRFQRELVTLKLNLVLIYRDGRLRVNIGKQHAGAV